MSDSVSADSGAKIMHEASVQFEEGSGVLAVMSLYREGPFLLRDLVRTDAAQAHASMHSAEALDRENPCHFVMRAQCVHIHDLPARLSIRSVHTLELQGRLSVRSEHIHDLPGRLSVRSVHTLEVPGRRAKNPV